MFRKLLATSLSLAFLGSLKAQVTVYSENFSTGTGWTLNVATGTNAGSSNAWEVNDSEGGVTPPGCGTAYNGNSTLHITCTSLFCGSLITGAVYNASNTTNKRAESPAISTIGYSNLTLTFNFISLGDGPFDNASVYYNSGSGWMTLAASIKSPICGSTQGQWTAYTVSLPASCNNVSNLQIAFNWTNNGDNIGSDPSVAIDDLAITGISPLSASVSQTNVTCFGLCDGSATVTPSGGTAPYSYVWSNGATTATATLLCAGTYTCTVTDGTSATTIVNVTITEPSNLILTDDGSTDVTCFGGSDGSASVNASGGTPGSGYTYDWTPGTPAGDGTMAINGLSAGSYSCTVTDANGCSDLINFTISEPSAITNTLNPIICNGDAFSVGSSTYTTAGTYTDVLTAANGCDSTVTTNLTVNMPTSSSINQTACGAYTLNAQTYTSSGTYTQTLTNNAGCDSVITLNLTINNVNVAVINASPTITAAATGATYQWVDCGTGFSTITGETNQSFTASSDGSYAVIVTENGCTDTSACVSIIGVGVDEFSAGILQVYPNPVSDVLQISNDGEIQSVYLYDVNGNVVYYSTPWVDKVTIDVGNLSNGVYLLEVRNAVNAVNKIRVVVNR